MILIRFLSGIGIKSCYPSRIRMVMKMLKIRNRTNQNGEIIEQNGCLPQNAAALEQFLTEVYAAGKADAASAPDRDLTRKAG